VFNKHSFEIRRKNKSDFLIIVPLQGICPLVQQYFCAAYDYVEKADLSKGYQDSKRKLGVTMHFSEIIELKFGKKLPHILCILTLF